MSNPYPETKPSKTGFYLIWITTGHAGYWTTTWWEGRWHFQWPDIISYWAELPPDPEMEA